MDTRIIIAGSRDFNDYQFLKEKTDMIISHHVIIFDPIKIISGHARGTDELGERYAAEKGYETIIFPADWNTYGKRAGYIRNVQMAIYASSSDSYSILIAFWNGKSKGTKMMIDIAEKYNISKFVFTIN